MRFETIVELLTLILIGFTLVAGFAANQLYYPSLEGNESERRRRR
jgi:hypothetical protein